MLRFFTEVRNYLFGGAGLQRVGYRFLNSIVLDLVGLIEFEGYADWTSILRELLSL